MKNKIVASLVLAMLAPVVGHAGPINWTTETYSIDGQLEFDSQYKNPPNRLPTAVFDEFSTSVNNLASPLVGSYTSKTVDFSTTTGTVSTDVSITNLSNANANIVKFTANARASYQGDRNPNHFAYLNPYVTMENTFVANTSVLNFSYDFNSEIHFGADATNLSYQDLVLDIRLRDLTSNTELIKHQDQELLGEYLGSQYGYEGIHYFNNSRVNGVVTYSAADQSDQPSYSGTRQFDLTSGHSYEVQIYLSPTILTAGSVTDSSSKSVVNLSFSDTVAAVPVPQTYALMLSGLALFGFTARRKQQS